MYLNGEMLKRKQDIFLKIYVNKKCNLFFLSDWFLLTKCELRFAPYPFKRTSSDNSHSPWSTIIIFNNLRKQTP